MCHAKSPGGIFHRPPAAVSPLSLSVLLLIPLILPSSTPPILPSSIPPHPPILYPLRRSVILHESICLSVSPPPPPPASPSPLPHLIHSLPSSSGPLFWPSLCSGGAQIMSDIYKPGLARITFIAQIPTLARKQISSAAHARARSEPSLCLFASAIYAPKTAVFNVKRK